MYCIRVTQVYFSLEKRASPWGSPEVSTPILSTQPHKICFGCLEVSTPVQYTTAQDMFGCRHGRFSTQPHKICLGVGIDGSVHNRSELIVTQGYFKRKTSSVLHLRSMHLALVPEGV